MEADVQQAWLLSPSGMGKSCQKRPTSTVAIWWQLLLAGLRAAGLGKATYSQAAWPGGSCRGQGRSAGVPFLPVNYYLYALSGLFPQFFLQNADLLQELVSPPIKKCPGTSCPPKLSIQISNADLQHRAEDALVGKN